MINMVAAKCPQCGADIEIDSSRESAFCTYCGAKIILTNENEHVYRHIDEAAIKQTENEYAFRLKKIELEEKHRTESKKSKRIRAIVSVALVLIAFLLFYLAVVTNEENLLFFIPIPVLIAVGLWISLIISARKKE